MEEMANRLGAFHNPKKDDCYHRFKKNLPSLIYPCLKGSSKPATSSTLISFPPEPVAERSGESVSKLVDVS